MEENAKTPKELAAEEVPPEQAGKAAIHAESDEEARLRQLEIERKYSPINAGGDTGLVNMKASQVGKGAGARDFRYLHTEQRMNDAERRLAEVKQDVIAEGDMTLVKCLICEHELGVQYVKTSLITHIYQVHKMHKVQYQNYCLEKKWVKNPADAIIRSPELNRVFRQGGFLGNARFFQTVDEGKTHLFPGDKGEKRADDLAKDREYILRHSDVPRVIGAEADADLSEEEAMEDSQRAAQQLIKAEDKEAKQLEE